MERVPRRNHQFDLLRILFAVLVLLSHAPELTDGNRSREILSRLTTPHFSFGMFGVDGFFLLSGFLIVKSWINSPRFGSFIVKRFLRICPGYVAAMLIGIVFVGLLPSGGLSFIRHGVSVVFGAFPENHYPLLNGSLWTIFYEFECYILVALWGMAGLFRSPKLWLMMTAGFLLRWINLGPVWHLRWPDYLDGLLGSPDALARFAAIFFVGGCFFLFRSKIRFVPWLASCCTLVVVAIAILKPQFAELGVVTFGSYVLFYIGSLRMQVLSWMAKVPDLSYGIYLYGWPVESLIIWRFHPSPWIVFFESTVICFGLAWFSWTFVESPALSLSSPLKTSPLTA